MNKPAVIRALLVVKDTKQRDLLQRALRQAGYVVDTATDGEEALGRITRATYQVLLADRDLSDMDAATLCRRVRESELLDYLYILLLAGDLSASEVAAELEAGADDYLRKPVDEAELGARLNSGQHIVRLEQSLREASARIRLNSDAQVRASTAIRRARRRKRAPAPVPAVVMTDLDTSLNDKRSSRRRRVAGIRGRLDPGSSGD
jgi:sigma-B regulation protein RsbU (phosphoserine phosphatase)